MNFDLKSSLNPLSRRQILAFTAGLLGGPSRDRGAPEARPLVPDRAARRVIIDTDPGVDDAMALLLAMRSPELKIEAITSVAGNVPLELTLPNALRTVEIAGRTDIPVAAGARAPLRRRLVISTFAHGSNGLGDVELPAPRMKAAQEPATEVIRRIVSANPGTVSIIAVGPLTNIAATLQAYPSLAKQIREIVLMGGSLSGGNMTTAAEFNMYVDPEAASVVFSSGVPVTMVGLDVTRKCTLTEDHVKALEAGTDGVSRMAARMTRNALERSRKSGWGPPVMHDPLAVATFIDRNIVRVREYFVAVDTQGHLTAGETLGYSRAPIRQSAPLESSPPMSDLESSTVLPNTKVAVEVDAPAFFELLIGRLTVRS